MPTVNGEYYTDDEYREYQEGQRADATQATNVSYPSASDSSSSSSASSGGVSSFGGSPTFDETGQRGSSTVQASSAYLTPDEARERGLAWVARPGEPQDLSDPYHYQTQDESTALGRDWATQQAIRSGNAVHAGFTPTMTPEQIRALGRTTPDEINSWMAGGGDPRMTNPRGSTFNPTGMRQGTTGYRAPFENSSPLFDDPASRLLEDYALDRMGQRTNPDPNSGTAMFEQYARELIDTLRGPVYSAQDEAVLKGKAINGIEMERSATKQRWVAEMNRRGISPSSGIYLDGLLKVDEHFNQARNTFETQFAADAIDQTRNQRMQVLNTAGQLAGSEEGRLREAGTYAAIPKQLQDNSFQQGLQLVGAGGSPQSVTNTLMQLQQLSQNQDQYQSAQRQAMTSGLLQYLGYIFS